MKIFFSVFKNKFYNNLEKERNYKIRKKKKNYS